MIACAIEAGNLTVVVDDRSLRALALAEKLPLVGTVGLLVWARLAGKIAELKPLLDQLIADGFRLDPAGSIYRDALTASAKAPERSVK